MKIEFHVGIIGAGFAGLVAALRLKKTGRESIYWLNEFIGLGLVGSKRVNRLMRWLTIRKLKRLQRLPL